MMIAVRMARSGWSSTSFGAFQNAMIASPMYLSRYPISSITICVMASRYSFRSATNPDHQLLEVRIGVHTGEVVVGNVGGKASFNYSAIGDDVNLAARLEPANKTYNTRSMVSEATLRAATGEYRVRELDYITVVGKEEPVKVFELLEMAGSSLAARLTASPIAE